MRRDGVVGPPDGEDGDEDKEGTERFISNCK